MTSLIRRPALLSAALLLTALAGCASLQAQTDPHAAHKAEAAAPAKPLSLRLRTGTGQGYWYRRYKAVTGKEVEDFVSKESDEPAREAMQQRMAAAAWTQGQVRQLRTLGMQVADKDVARLLVELHARQLFGDGGLVLVGTRDGKPYRVEIDLPLLLRPMKGMVEGKVTEKLDRAIGS